MRVNALDRAVARLAHDGLSALANRHLSVSIDACQGDPGAIALREAARRGDWPAVRAFLAGVTESNARYFYLRIVAEVRGSQTWLERVVRTYPEDMLGLLVYGHRLIAWAWESRGDGRAGTVTRGDARDFHERLARAEAYFGEVVNRNPADADAWSGLVTCNRGLGRGLAEAWRRFNGSRAADANHLGAHRHMVQQLCGKWGGDDRMMLRFATDLAAGAPEGSPITALIPDAHLELSRYGDPRHIRQPDVIEEIRRAAARGPNSPVYRPFPGDAVVHNLFARVFMFAKVPAEARPHFAAAGDRVAAGIWAGDDGYVWPEPLIHLSYLAERRKANR